MKVAFGENPKTTYGNQSVRFSCHCRNRSNLQVKIRSPEYEFLPLCAGLAAKHGLSMEEALKAITIYPARICRVDDRVGSLKKGKDADIAIFSGNPLEIFTKTLYTIIDGEIIYENHTY